MDGDPPPYYPNDGPISPPYSLQPAEAEIQLSLTPSTTTWHYHTKHMRINLEAGRWGLQYPCYGLNGNVKGSMSFSGSPHSIERVSISLEVLVSTSRSGSVSPVLSRAFLLHEIGTKDSSGWTGEHPFSIRIPTEIALEGKAIPTPPSCSSVSFAASCQTSFSIKMCMYRKGSSWRKTEVKVIPILYLPKSSPKSPPLTCIPRPSILEFADMSTACLQLFERVQTTALQPFWSSSCKHRPQSKLLLFDRTVNFSVPAPKSYTSGDAIPYTISLVFPDRPFMSKLLFPCISVVLYKRITIRTRKRRKKDLGAAYTRDWPIATGQFRYQNVYKEGMVLYRGSIDAGKASEECSWRLDDMVEVQFFLRAMVTPPKYLQEYVPNFMHEEVVELATDHYGALSRELIATGEIPPALGLMKASEPVESRPPTGCPTIV